VSVIREIPLAAEPQKAKDFKSDQEVRWCPGCGDYAILATVQGFLPELNLKKENIVFISGIGCSSRFPYYMNTYGLHSIHGRAPAIATGLAVSRPDLSIWVVTGDGDALSIGGNHLIHLLRRNVDVKVLLFNNRIYGLTKGQYSPTSEVGKITKSTPLGSIEKPLDAASLAIGAEATFVARALDSDRKQLTEVLRAAANHKGTAFVEIYQNCNIFNDGAFDVLKNPETKDEAIINLVAGEPIKFGKDGSKAVVRGKAGLLEVVDTESVNESEIWVHDPTLEDPSIAFALTRLADNESLKFTTLGVLRNVKRATYDEAAREQVEQAKTKGADLAALLKGNDTWIVK
jgi:2-oxoglutarate/2-oxoacid ferredoxin oxidoreductase subunit beta